MHRRPPPTLRHIPTSPAPSQYNELVISRPDFSSLIVPPGFLWQSNDWREIISISLYMTWLTLNTLHFCLNMAILIIMIVRKGLKMPRQSSQTRLMEISAPSRFPQDKSRQAICKRTILKTVFFFFLTLYLTPPPPALPRCDSASSLGGVLPSASSPALMSVFLSRCWCCQ